MSFSEIIWKKRDSLDFGNTMIENEFRHFGFLSEEKTNYLLFTYEPAEISKDLGTAKTDAGLLKYAPANDVFYALRFNGEGHDFDVYGTIRTLEEYEEQGLPVRIFGFPSFLYFTVKQMKETGHRPLKYFECPNHHFHIPVYSLKHKI